MLDSTERVVCEAVRKAHTIDIILNDNAENRMVIRFDERNRDISKLRSEIRLALQGFYNDNHRGHSHFSNR